MLAPDDFPLSVYGCAIFTALNPAPIVVMPSPALAQDFAKRLNEGEIAAMICDAVEAEENAAKRRDGQLAAERCARLIRGRQRDQDAATMDAARGTDPVAEETGAWSLDRGVNDGKPVP